VTGAASRSPGRRFVFLWLGAFAFFLSFLLLLSALPIFARRELSASDAAVGGITASFGATSLLCRPLAGWGTDRYGRRPFMLAGSLIFAIASLAYAWTSGVVGMILVRLLHGTGMGLYPTAASAMVADLTPPHRRGEILGLYGAAGSLALAIGPIIGIAVVERLGFTWLFWIAATVAAISTLLIAPAGETLTLRRRTAFSRADVMCPAALLPSIVVLCMTVTYGTQVAFLPLHADSHGLNPGVFFLVFALMTTVVRHPAGRLSDRHGRAPIATIGLVLAAAALVVLALRETTLGLGLAGAIYGLAYGVAQPALIAWSVDAAAEGERGRAVGTFYAAFEIGIAIGALGAGLAVARWGFTTTFIAVAAVPIAGAALALAGRR
jgi:MFS family permease